MGESYYFDENALKKKINSQFEALAKENYMKMFEEDGHKHIDCAHYHICDFVILGRKKPKKDCKKYLKTVGLKRNKYLYCCDCCKYMKTLYSNPDDVNDIIFITSPTNDELIKFKSYIEEYLNRR